MDRPSRQYGYLAIVLILAASVLPSGGCRTVFATVAYLVKGTDVPADYAGLEEKKVVVVCRPMVDLTYRNSNVAKRLAREVTLLLKERVPKIEVVDPREVEAYVDENIWEDFVEVGEALEADMVVGIDLRSFSLYQSQVLYQGKADAVVGVYECGGDGQAVFERTLAQTLYPPNASIPTYEVPEPEFRRKFVRVMADQIGRHFYDHDPHADMAMDAQAFE